MKILYKIYLSNKARSHRQQFGLELSFTHWDNFNNTERCSKTDAVLQFAGGNLERYLFLSCDF